MACNKMKEKRRLMGEFASSLLDMRLILSPVIISYSKIEQEIHNRLHNKFFWCPQYYATGSTFEGMPLDVCNDRDTMICKRTFPIVLFNSQGVAVRPFGFVKAEQDPNAPFYLKLKVVDKNRHIFEGMIDNNGYLKTNDFINYNQTTENCERRGPSFSSTALCTFMGYTQTLRDDSVYCLKCQSWPPITDDFFTRERPNNWPSQELLHTVDRLECLVVAIGPHNNTWKDDTEWRLSFSLAEAALIHKMQKPYIKCMYCMKALKNKYILYNESDRPTPFCSYFIKTACLWMCERCPHKEYSFIDLVKRVFDWLIACYQKQILENYFIPKQNMIGHLSKHQCDGVIEKLTAIKRQLWKKVMPSIHIHLDVREAVINHMCDRLNITRVDKDEDYTELETNLLKHPRAIHELKDSLRQLYIQMVAHEKFETSMCVGRYYRNILVALSGNIDYNLEIFEIPEEIMMPIIHNIHKIVDEQHRELFKHVLYIFLGNLYTYLLIHFQKSGNSIPLDSPCWAKPLHYYELGTDMISTEKWSDCGLSSQAVIVMHHYLMSNYKEISEKLKILKPKLLKIIDDPLLMNSQITILIPTLVPMVIDTWAIDDILHHFAKELGEFHLHPIALVFYINASVLIREGKIENARLVVKELQKCLEQIITREIFKTTELLILIIQSIIGLLEVMRMIMEQLNTNKTFAI